MAGHLHFSLQKRNKWKSVANQDGLVIATPSAFPSMFILSFDGTMLEIPEGTEDE